MSPTDKPDADAPSSTTPPEGSITEDAGQGKTMLVRVDERNMNTDYANAFRTNTTPEEVIMDFGLNLVTPAPEAAQAQAKGKVDGQILFQINNRVIVNYFTAKRLAISLGQVVRMREEQSGEIQVNTGQTTRSK